MKLEDLYQKVKTAVCRETEISEDSLLHSSKESCVDARAILIHILIKKKISENEISKLTGLTQQCINKQKNNFDIRLQKWSVTTNLQSVINDLTTE